MCCNNLSYKSVIGITVVESRYLRKGAIKQKEAKGILSANATWNSKSRWQIRDSSKYELFGKGEKKADTNDGEGLQAPFTTLQSILTIWHTFLIWTVFRDLFLSPYTTQPDRKVSQHYCYLASHYSNSPCLKSRSWQHFVPQWRKPGKISQMLPPTNILMISFYILWLLTHTFYLQMVSHELWIDNMKKFMASLAKWTTDLYCHNCSEEW